MSEDRSASLIPPYAGRLERLRAALSESRLQDFVVSHPANIRYLSGFTGSSGLLVVGSDSVHLLTDFRYEEQAGEELDPAVDLWMAREGLFRELGARRWAAPKSRIGFEAAHVSVREARELEEVCEPAGLEPVEGLVERLRRKKDPGEVTAIERAARIGDRALEETLESLRVGMTELEIVAELEYRLRGLGSEGPAFESIVATGPRSALPHARPSGRRLGGGDLLLLDFGARQGGYCSDMTRTFVVGEPSPWQRRAYEAVHSAQRAALEALAVGRTGREMDRTARDVLEELGYGKRFGHSLGHGIGLEVHEDPRLSRRSTDVLADGDVVTIEPGVYLSGQGGVRIEDDVHLHDGGCRRLTSYPRELIAI